MTFNVSSSLLFGRLQAISRVINSRNSLPILEYFLFRIEDSVLSITASDNETTMVTSVNLNSSDSNGSFAIAAKTILDSLKELPEQPLNFIVDINTYGIIVKYQNGVYNLIGQNADEFPQSATVGNDSVRLNINGQVLMNSLNRTFFATADDELRPVMNGIYFDITSENITIVASDGHKLVRCKVLDTHGAERAAFILPKKPASLLKGLLPKEMGNIDIEFDQRNAVFILENYRMVCRLIEGRYPNYNSVIPQSNPYKVTADRQQLLSALRRVSIFSSQGSSLIKFRLQENTITISAQDIDFSTSAEETLVCQYVGDEMSIGFKSSFFIEILSNISANEVVIELADPSRAGIILPSEQEENEDLLMLLMPMMLND
ncbi:DNA polymerase III subunit beta [termite gut metagenome]|uniref:DNA polymerase III subunit beta n=1 Tax=termite gut metagenome TaxID=433724 RepID=A0A5J4SQZ0_9ZZZZ